MKDDDYVEIQFRWKDVTQAVHKNGVFTKRLHLGGLLWVVSVVPGTDRLIERIRAEFSAESMDAGENKSACETCSNFKLTGWNMDTVNKVLDRVKRQVQIKEGK